MDCTVWRYRTTLSCFYKIIIETNYELGNFICVCVCFMVPVVPGNPSKFVNLMEKI